MITHCKTLSYIYLFAGLNTLQLFYLFLMARL